MKRIYIVTGANGHLGSTIIRLLKKEKQVVRGLVLPGEEVLTQKDVTYYQGDVRDKDSLRPLFDNLQGQ